MKIYHHIDEFAQSKHAVVTIGTFDGVHYGHRKIISRLNEIATQTNGETVILTFFPHPRMILHPEDVNLKLITTIEEKAELLQELGIDHLIITPFTRDFSNLSPQQYIKEILIDKIGTRNLVIGHDHRFGKDREGGFTDLKHFAAIYQYQVEEIPEQDIHNVAVSSSKTRAALIKGDITTANDFLGYSFHLTGKVIKGDQIGRKLGYPTVNLFIEESYKLIPADGIYAVTVEIEKSEPGSPKSENSESLKGMAYIGHRPTISGMTRNIEAHIFDFAQDIYGNNVRIYFKKFIRDDIKFDSLEQLKVQLVLDEKEVRKYFEI